MTTTTELRTTATPALSLRRLYAMRGGYLLMGLGLAVVKCLSWLTRPRCRCTRASPRPCSPPLGATPGYRSPRNASSEDLALL